MYIGGHRVEIPDVAALEGIAYSDEVVPEETSYPIEFKCGFPELESLQIER